jgi:hypothetical protein
MQDLDPEHALRFLQLARMPVANELVFRYGRGRSFFPQPVPFNVPLLIATAASPEVRRFYGVLVDISNSDMRQWKVLVPLNLTTDLSMFQRNLYTLGELEGLHRMWPQQGENAFLRRLVVFADNKYLWLPWRLCQPFNLMGFTVLGDVRTYENHDAVLAALKTYKPYTIMASTIKPGELDFVLLSQWPEPHPMNTEPLRETSLPLASTVATMASVVISVVPGDCMDLDLLPSKVELDCTWEYVMAHPTARNMAQFFFNFLELRKDGMLTKAGKPNRRAVKDKAWIFPALDPDRPIRGVRDDFNAVLCKFKDVDTPMWTSQQHWNWLSDPDDPDNKIFQPYSRYLKKYLLPSTVTLDEDIRKHAEQCVKRTLVSEKMAKYEVQRQLLEEEFIRDRDSQTKSLSEYERAVHNRIMQARRRERRRPEEES